MDTEIELVMSERQGVEIDYCPTCRGVWLDRGELDKILDRAATLAAPPPSAAPAEPEAPIRSAADPLPTYEPRPAPGYDTPRYDTPRYDTPRYDAPRYDTPRYDDRGDSGYVDPRYGDPRYRDDRGRPAKKKRKESWLGDILDFG